jgi:transposase
MKKQRKHYTPEEKVAILRRHLLDKEPISKLCDELGLQPTVFYPWQKEFFENGAAAFEQKRPANHSAEQERIAYLEKKIQTRTRSSPNWIDEADAVIQKIAGENEACRRLIAIPGIGPVTATAIIAAIGNGAAFKKGRGFSAWLGIVPGEYTTGGKQKLLGISKRGNSYLRRLLCKGPVPSCNRARNNLPV